MKATRHLAEEVVHRVHTTLPWAVLLAISTSIGYAMNSAALGAASVYRDSEALASAAENGADPCSLDADGVLYARWDWWLPAGKSAFCRAETYPGLTGRKEMASQLRRAGRMQATITFMAPTGTRVGLHCLTSSRQQSTTAAYVSAAEARVLFESVCSQAGSTS
jgi:hypothetical protein